MTTHLQRPQPLPPTRPAPVPGARATRVVVTATGSVIAACAFTFSFGNIWQLARAWGVPDPIAPLVAPMLDISVIGLLTAIRYLSLNGIPGRRLLTARLLMLACAATTWGLNIAQAVIDHRWGAVVMDSVAPALLLGWAEVAPTLLRLTTDTELNPTTAPPHTRPTTRTPRPIHEAAPSLAPPPDVPRLPTTAQSLDPAHLPGTREGRLPDAA